MVASIRQMDRVPRSGPTSAREEEPELEEDWTEHYARQADGDDLPEALAEPLRKSSPAPRVPPHDLDAEAAVLSALLLDPDTLARLADLRPEHFYSEANRQIYVAALALRDAGTPIDIVTVAGRLRDVGRLDQAGGSPYLAQIVDAVPSVAHAEVYAARIRDLARLRQLIATATEIAARSYDVADVDAWISHAREHIASVGALPASRFEWVDSSAVFAPLPATDWIVPGLQLCPGRPAMLQAYGATGKTIIAQALALAVSSDTRAFGEFLCRRGLIARHVDYEQGLHATCKRYQRLALGHGIDPATLKGRLLVSVFPSVYLNTVGAEDAWAREFEGVGLGLIDAFRGAIPGDDENDSTVRAYIDGLSRVSAKTGTAFLLLHHTGKSKEGHEDVRQRARGSSAIFDACGCVLDLSGTKDEPKKVEQAKQPAEAEGGPLESFYLEFVDVPNGSNPRAGLKVVYRTREQVEGGPKTPAQVFDDKVRSVYDAIIADPGIKGASRIAEVLNLRKATVIEAVNILIEQGRIKNLGADPKHPSYFPA